MRSLVPPVRRVREFLQAFVVLLIGIAVAGFLAGLLLVLFSAAVVEQT